MEIAIIVLGLILVICNYKKVFSEVKNFADELNIKKKDELDVKFIELRSEIAESFLQEQQEIEELKNQIVKLSEDIYSLRENIKDTKVKKTVNKKYKDKKDSTDNEKVERVRHLLMDNTSIEDICYKTGVGKGEVLLIKELFPL